MEQIKVNDPKILMKLCKYLASLSAYPNIDINQPLRVYLDSTGELLAFEGVIHNLVWTNNRHKLTEIADVITRYEVMTFQEFRNAIYSLA